MEATSRLQENNNTSPTNSYESSTNNNNGGLLLQSSTPTTPKSVPRSDPNPYPTTFVQANTSNFKHVVQMLTGSSDPPSPPPPPMPSKTSIPLIKTGQKKQGFKLYERRNSLKNGLMINPNSGPRFGHGGSVLSPRIPEILSPSILDFPSLVLSPVTPLIADAFDKSSPLTVGGSEEEDRAIAEKRFYLHPSPRTPAAEPQLLPLFPLTSPRVSGSSS